LLRDAALARLEAVLFSADEPLSLRRLAALAQLGSSEECQSALNRLHDLYETEGAAFQIVEIAGGFQLLTRPDFFPWLARVRDARHAERLSGALLETLAIVAYRQPIMRADIEAIRGVQSGDALRELMERGLVRIAGRDQSLGRPIIYGTTKRFLQAFGLRDLSDLPPMDPGAR
jgi:segregation and condensation protein B